MEKVKELGLRERKRLLWQAIAENWSLSLSLSSTNSDRHSSSVLGFWDRDKNGVLRDRFQLCFGVSAQRPFSRERLLASSDLKAPRLCPRRRFNHSQTSSGMPISKSSFFFVVVLIFWFAIFVEFVPKLTAYILGSGFEFVRLYCVCRISGFLNLFMIYSFKIWRM